MSDNIIVRLFSSRKFFVALVAVIFHVVVLLVPGLAEHSDKLQEATLVLAGLFILGVAAEDIAKFLSARPTDPIKALVQMLQEAIGVLNGEEEAPEPPKIDELKKLLEETLNKLPKG